MRIALLAFLLVGVPAAFINTEAQQRTEIGQSVAPVSLHWKGRPGVRRYRLQVAHDSNFKDIVLDQIVMGYEYSLTILPPGSYFWHVAPARNETGRYSGPEPLQVVAASSARRGGPIIKPPVETRPALLTPPANSGWRALTGDIARPIAAHLRTASSYDFVGVNTDGTVYTLDGASGTALWSARYRPGARRGEPTGSGGAGAAVLTPLPLKGQNGLANILVAYEGGVRALDGATGRELWRAPLTERAVSGSGGPDVEGPISLVTNGAERSSLVMLDAAAGRILSNTKLDGAVIGAPVPFVLKETRGVVLGLSGGMLDMRGMSGERLRSIKMDTEITTPPLIIEGQFGPMILVGTENGLISLDLAELRPLGRIATEEDAPRGILSAVDLDGDGAMEVVMLTRKGRVVVIGSADGKIRWYKNGAMDAASAAFADLNQDGMLDVLVAAGPNFALGFSGRDGTIIWVAEEPGGGIPAGQATGSLRSLVAASPGSGGVAFVVGSDPAHMTLRAVGLPNGAIRSSVR